MTLTFSVSIGQINFSKIGYIYIVRIKKNKQRKKTKLAVDLRIIRLHSFESTYHLDMRNPGQSKPAKLVVFSAQ